MIGTVAGVARSFEITKPDGSSPWATMACSSSGSLRMNSAENPPTVDCSVIDTVGLARTLCPSWSSGRAGRFKRPRPAALLYGDPYDFNSLNAPNSIADYFRAYY